MNSRKNILYIFHVSIIGGGSFCLLNMIKRLDKESFNPIVLLKDRGPLVIELEKIGATVYLEKSISTVLYNKSILKISSIKQLYGVIRSISKVKYWLKETKADIVHINSMMLYPYLWPAYQLKTKTVIHMRENWPKDEHQIQFGFARNIINKYADKIIAINQTSADILGILSKTEIIFDWIDFENRDDSTSYSELFGNSFKTLKIFVFLGGIQKSKGALEIVETFTKELPMTDIRLLFVGCDSKNITYQGIKGYVKKMLSHFNYHSYYDKIKYFAQHDKRIVFIPSTYKIKSIIEQSYCLLSFHTMPHANLLLAESVYLGKPVITALTPETLDYSNNGESALLVEMNNKRELKEKMIFAIENNDLINLKAKAGMMKIRDLFDPVRNYDLLDKLYKSL